MVVVSDSVSLRRSLTVWWTFLSQYKTINLGIGGDRAENVLWRVNNMVSPVSVRSIVIHCSANNIDTSNSDEISLGMFPVTGSISKRYPNIEIIVSALFPREIDWSIQSVKIKKTNTYLKDYGNKSTKITVMSEDPDCTLPDKSLNMQLSHRDRLYLSEKKRQIL